MRSPAAAIAWEFRQRHRWGFFAMIGYLVALAAPRLFSVEFHSAESFAFAVTVPMSAAFIYFLAVFSFGLDGDLAARHSIYPSRMFALPVTNGALAGWPMLYGTAAVAVLWFATRLVAVWPRDVDVPMIWPALLAASLLAWTQALTWMPYAMPGLRVIITVIWLASIDGVVLIALQYRLPEPVMLAILAPHIPLAYFVARFAVARARHGDTPDWHATLDRPVRISGREQFPSPARAQMWFEWRVHGRSLPALVAILLPFELAMLFLFRRTPAIVFETILCVLLTPPFMAVFIAATVSKPAPPFLATRPLTSAALVAAKLKAALGSTLAAWLLVLLTLPIALARSGTLSEVLERARDTVGLLGTARATAIVLLVFALLIASTWKQLVQSLWIGMSGREWVVKTSVLLVFVLLVIIGPITEWIGGSRAAVVVLWNAFPWIAAALVCLKIPGAVWIAARLHDQSLISDRALIAGAAIWDVLVFALYGLLVWVFPQLLIRYYLLALVAILEIPLVRISAAPLALAWSRHR